jgi:hypothetical protein
VVVHKWLAYYIRSLSGRQSVLQVPFFFCLEKG